MAAPPDWVVVHAFVARVTRRLAWVAAAHGAAAGLGVALATILLGWDASGVVFIGAVSAALGAAAGAVASLVRRHRIAHVIERRAPQCRNLLVTASELAASEGASRAADTPIGPYVRALVWRDAARLARSLDPAGLFPARRAVAALATSAALWGAAAALRSGVGPITLPNVMPAVPAIDAVEVTVTPPTYVGPRAATTVRDPARIEALAGSGIRLTVRARAATVAIETLRGRHLLTAAGRGTFTGELPADADGFIALEPARSDGTIGVRRLVGLSVVADAPPRVRVTVPGRDLLLPNGNRSLELTVGADDDIGLASLRLRFTRVSGSGERFTFNEGDVPLAVSRAGARTWTARASWRLDPLALQPGDMVVYRAIAADVRPGAPLVESDSWIAEVAAPGGVAAAGFALDPEQERYALSQQMVILKTERLLARRPTLPPAALADEAAEVAAEQRKVRAELVFMMGGEMGEEPAGEDANLADLNEDAEAAAEEDLAAGRMVNQGRVALLRAIRSMSRAARALTDADLSPALGHERAALAQLERAFSHSRIILRALTERERLDLSRRLTAPLTDAARTTRPAVEATPAPSITLLQAALADVAALAGAPRFGAGAAAQASTLAERVLRVDASAKPLQAVATVLTSAATAIGAGRAVEARGLLARATVELSAAARADLLDAPGRGPDPLAGSLEGALRDALRRRRSARR